MKKAQEKKSGWLAVLLDVAVVAPALAHHSPAAFDRTKKVTLVGTVTTAVFELDRVTIAPPEGAGPLSVTVPVEELPPTTLAGARVTV